MSQDKILVLIITIISITALTSFAMSPFFNVDKIELNGLYYLNDQEVLSQINEYQNNNIFLLDQRNIQSKLLDYTIVEKVDIAKKLPDSIHIKINEREPIARIKNFGQFLIFTSEGYILNSQSDIDILVPEIRGFAYSIYMDRIDFSPLVNELVQALEIVDIE